MIDQLIGTSIPPDPIDPAGTSEFIADDGPALSRSARAKLADARTPGYQAEFDPAEAEAAGAFVEDAFSATDALESAQDSPPVAATE